MMILYTNSLKKLYTYCSSHKHCRFHLKTKRKLICVVIVAGLALLGFIKMRQQFMVTHLSIFNLLKKVSRKTELSILNLEEWAESETLDFQEVVINSIEYAENRHTKSIHPIELTDIKQSEQRQRIFSKIVIDGIFWSSEVEVTLPSGPSDQQTFENIQKLRRKKVEYVDSFYAPGPWGDLRGRCGRPKNRFVSFEDGSNACCRYRGSEEMYLQGELMAFYLGRLLGISSIPVVVLSETNSSQWNKFTNSYKENWTEVKKGESALVEFIEWLPNLENTMMPDILFQKLQANESKFNPLDGSELNRLPESDLKHFLIDLVQWSDLIIFDYLIGNFDRAAIIQGKANLRKNSTLRNDDISNLGKNSKTNLLWLFDNESGLIAGYSLLNSENVSKDGNTVRRSMNGKMFQAFHQKMLETNCIFRKRTVKRLYALYKSSNPSQLLLSFVSTNEPLFKTRLPTIHETSFFIQNFKDRVHMVWKWIKQCQSNSNKYQMSIVDKNV